MSDIDHIEQILRDLIAKRDAHIESGTKLADARREIAFAAHTGDQAARKKLDAFNHQLATHLSELESLDAAIAEATARLEAARRDEATAADRANAGELQKALGEFRDCGHKVSKALATFVAEANGFSEALSRIHGLGCVHPTNNQVEIYARLAVMSAFMEVPWRWRREFDQVAPGQRRSFGKLVDDLSISIQRQIGAVLGEAEQKDEAA